VAREHAPLSDERDQEGVAAMKSRIATTIGVGGAIVAFAAAISSIVF
jgi:hypothetical protein